MLGDAVATAFRGDSVDAHVARDEVVRTLNRIKVTGARLVRHAGETRLAFGSGGEMLRAGDERLFRLHRVRPREQEQEGDQRKLSA